MNLFGRKKTEPSVTPTAAIQKLKQAEVRQAAFPPALVCLPGLARLAGGSVCPRASHSVFSLVAVGLPGFCRRITSARSSLNGRVYAGNR